MHKIPQFSTQHGFNAMLVLKTPKFQFGHLLNICNTRAQILDKLLIRIYEFILGTMKGMMQKIQS